MYVAKKQDTWYLTSFMLFYWYWCTYGLIEVHTMQPPQDFLAAPTELPQFDLLVTYPPFGKRRQFMRTA
jgi:hypothetical protein